LFNFVRAIEGSWSVNIFPAPLLRSRRMRMQNCSLLRKNRKRGFDVWLLRWSDKSTSGKRIYRKRVIGTLDEYLDSESVRQVVAGLIHKINAANPRIGLCSTTLAQPTDHFERIELAQCNTWRSYSTKRCYGGYLKRWIVPQWGQYELRSFRLSCSRYSDLMEMVAG
jgi:hypothetical protein